MKICLGIAPRIALLMIGLTCGNALAKGVSIQGSPGGPSIAASKVPGKIFSLLAMDYAVDTNLYFSGMQWTPGAPLLTRILRERSSAAEPWSEVKKEENTDFSVTGLVSSPGGSQVYVAGVRPDGTVVLQLWTYPPREGGWYVAPGTATPQTPLGQPASVPQYQRTVFGQPTWSAPAPGATLPSANRTTLIESAAMGALTSLEVDPLGRFLLFFDHGLNALMQLDLLSAGALPQPILVCAPATQFDQIFGVNLWEFPGEGMQLYLRRRFPGDGPEVAQWHHLLPDPENDGVFALPGITMTTSQFKASPYGQLSQWNRFTGQ